MILIPFLGSMSIIGTDAVIGIGIHSLTTVPADDEEQAIDQGGFIYALSW